MNHRGAAAEVSKKGNWQESHIRINHSPLKRKTTLASESSSCFFAGVERIFYSGGIIHLKLRSHLGTERAHLSSLRKERRQQTLC